MSSLIVQVRQITGIRPHQNPLKTRIEIAEIEGWQTIVKKDAFAIGDKVVYFPPDTVLSQEWTDTFDVTNYTDKGRIRTIKLDKEMSFGLVVKPHDPSWPIGYDAAAFYSAKKYEPPARDRHSGGPNNPPGTGKRNSVPGFHKYTDLEHLRHFAHLLDGQEVIFTLKIHGTNTRHGFIHGELVVGSRNCIREYPSKYTVTQPRNLLHRLYLWSYRVVRGKPQVIQNPDPAAAKQCWYYHLLEDKSCGQVEEMLCTLASEGHKNPAIYGESYGPSVQNMTYGVSEGQLAWKAFDISIDGQYLSWDKFKEICDRFNIPTVPLLYRGPYSLEIAQQYATGPDPIYPKDCREGIVIKPATESVGPNGRLIFKLINNDYLLRKESGSVSDSTDN